MPTSARLREWRKKTYADRRSTIFHMLGDACAKCGCTGKLEIDHKDAAQKSFEVSVACWWMAWERLLPEVMKCQLLCESCHDVKTVADCGKQHAKGQHGRLSCYKNYKCRCDLCRAANRASTLEYKHRTGRATNYLPRTGLVHGTGNAYGYYKCRCDICKAWKHQEYVDRKQRLQ